MFDPAGMAAGPRTPASPMKAPSLLLLRISLGLLMLVWGADKLANPAHGLQVSEYFYFGLFGSVALLKAFGVFQLLLGALVVAGALRRLAYPVLLAITAATLVGVWRSVADPWGWYLEGSNVLFFPSLIIFAAALVLFAHPAEDALSFDAWRARRRGTAGAAAAAGLGSPRGS